jgi:hypothetical protein
MQLKVLYAVAAIALAGCAGNDQGTEGRSFGEIVVATVASPVLIAAKVGICAATIGIAAPVGAAATLSSHGRDKTLAGLAEGVDSNCGPPYLAVQR